MAILPLKSFADLDQESEDRLESIRASILASSQRKQLAKKELLSRCDEAGLVSGTDFLGRREFYECVQLLLELL
jgi:hypothetical protein